MWLIDLQPRHITVNGVLCESCQRMPSDEAAGLDSFLEHETPLSKVPKFEMSPERIAELKKILFRNPNPESSVFPPYMKLNDFLEQKNIKGNLRRPREDNTEEIYLQGSGNKLKYPHLKEQKNYPNLNDDPYDKKFPFENGNYYQEN
jgi:hypothetical protein